LDCPGYVGWMSDGERVHFPVIYTRDVQLQFIFSRLVHPVVFIFVGPVGFHEYEVLLPVLGTLVGYP